MSSYSDWISTKISTYTIAMTNAYVNRENSNVNNPYRLAWEAMGLDSTISNLRPLASSAFYGESPTASEDDIEDFETWLNANPTEAGYLNLKAEMQVQNDDGRKSLGSAGNIGSEKRKWKGNPLYTFANGILIGKDSKVVAAIGTEGGEDIDGFGTDTLVYFDGLPGSKGTDFPGTAVFAGDMVVSGSIQGSGGIVIIDDVIQLEQNVPLPAGIGVDPAGKIRLRHRGEGFLDLVEESERLANEAEEGAKRWVGGQNTSSSRWGTSLIPNSNFSLLEIPDGTYSEVLVGIASVGSEDTVLTSPETGIAQMPCSGVGFVFQAIPVPNERYTVRIRYKGSVALEPDDDGAGDSEGLFLEFHETTEEDIGTGKYYIYDTGAPPGALLESSKSAEIYSNSLTRTYPTGLITYRDLSDPTDDDGASIETTYSVKTFTYEKSSTDVKNASLVIYTKNATGTIDFDYIVLTEAPPTSSEVRNLSIQAANDIALEVENLILDARMADISKWGAFETFDSGSGPSKIASVATILENSTDGEEHGDAAINITCPALSGGDGMLSSQTACESDKYIVGVRIKAENGTSTDVSIFAVENSSENYSTFNASSIDPLLPVSNYTEIGINTIVVDDEGAPATDETTGEKIPASSAQTVDDSQWYNIIGTYSPTIVYKDAAGDEVSPYDPNTVTEINLPSTFCLGIETSSNCELLVDYFYCKLQGSSIDIASTFANEAYSDAEGFVTAMNELLVKESGSIINNANMASLDSTGKPAGYRSPNTMMLQTENADGSGDRSIKIVLDESDSSASGDRLLASPPFQLGTSDKFSIGVRAKTTDVDNGNLQIKIVYLSASEGDGTGRLDTGQVTIGSSPDFDTVSDIVTTANVESITIDDSVDSDAEGPDDEDPYTYLISTSSYSSALGTWTRQSTDSDGVPESTGAANAIVAAVIVECDQDFIVDYILVKEQVCSYDLADTRAAARRDEAIAQVDGYVEGINETISQESGSMISNASFGLWYVDSTSEKQRPEGWFTTRTATSPLRVLATHESPEGAAARDKETVEAMSQTGSALKFSPGTQGGVLSRYLQLPAGSSWVNPEDDTVHTTTGTYTFAINIRLNDVNGEEPVGVRLRAHEYFSYVDGAQTHVWCTDGTYGSATYEDSGTPNPQIKTFSEDNSEGQVVRIGPINVTTDDTSAGYDPEDDGYASADDQYVEYIPVDVGETDGDPENPADNFATWYTIAGTYTPHASTKQVSFEILIDGDPDNAGAGDTNIPDVYIDYASLTIQPFDADFAQTLADARVESLTGIGSAGWSGGDYSDSTLAAAILSVKDDIDDLQNNLASEDQANSLLPNSFFADVTGNNPDNWQPTRDQSAQATINDQGYGSYNTYIALANSSGHAADENGILSTAVAVVGDGVNTFGITDGGLSPDHTEGGYPSFDFVVRYRGMTQPESEKTDGIVIRADSSTDEATQSVAATDFPVSLENGIGNSITVGTGLALNTNQLKEYEISGTNKNATWEIPYNGYNSNAFYLHQGPEDLSELIIVFRHENTDGPKDPKLEFLNHDGTPFAVSGTVQVWDSEVLEVEFAISDVTEILYWDGGSSENFMSSTQVAQSRWVVIKISSQLWSDEPGATDDAWDDSWDNYLHSFKLSGTAGNQSWTAKIQHMQLFSYKLPDPEQVSLQLIAHEYYYDDIGDNTHVYEEGGSYTLSNHADDTVIQRFVGGGAGNAVDIEAILTQEDTTLETETASASHHWKTLVGAYIPSQMAKWVSFEIVFNRDKDNDNTNAICIIDGVLLQKSDNTPLAQDIKGIAEAAASDAALVLAGLGSEQGSFIPNAGFLSPKVSSTSTIYSVPSGFYPYYGTPALLRIQNGDDATSAVTEGTAAADISKDSETEMFVSDNTPYYDVGQQGTALVVIGADWEHPYIQGFYTKAIALPEGYSVTYTDADGVSQTTTDKGAYAFSVKVKPASSSLDLGIRVFAHEYDTDTAPVDAGSYIYSPENTTYGSFGYKAGYSDDITPTQATRSTPTAIEITKLTGSDTTSGDLEIIQEGQWTNLGGTYIPTSTAAAVSFSIEFTFDTDNEVFDGSAENVPDGPTFGSDTWTRTPSGGSPTQKDLRLIAYVDYIMLTTQTISQDIAEKMAQGAAKDVEETLSIELSSLSGNLTAESDSLIPNGNFLQTFTDTSNYLKYWIPTGASGANKVQAYSSNYGSIGSHVRFQDSSGDDIYGIVSKAILHPGTLVQQSDGSYNAFNFGLRIRGVSNTFTPGTTSYSIPNVINHFVNTGNQGYIPPAGITSHEDGDTPDPLSDTGLDGIESYSSGYIGAANPILGKPGPNEQANLNFVDASIFGTTVTLDIISGMKFDRLDQNIGDDWLCWNRTEEVDYDNNTSHGDWTDVSIQSPDYYVEYTMDSSVGNQAHFFVYHTIFSSSATNTGQRIFCDLINTDSGQSLFPTGMNAHHVHVWAYRAVDDQYIVDDTNTAINNYECGYLQGVGYYFDVKLQGSSPSSTNLKADEQNSVILCWKISRYNTNPALSTDLDEVSPYFKLRIFPVGWDTATVGRPTDWGVSKYYNFQCYPNRVETTTPDQNSEFKIRVQAVEYTSSSGLSDVNVAVIDTSAQLNGADTPAAETGLTTVDGTARPLNIIDLKYSGSELPTDTDEDGTPDDGWITIDKDNQDEGENLQDWREIYGSYKPTEDVTAVSFWLQVNSDPNNDGLSNTVVLDSMTLSESSVSSDLATIIATNRVFVEANFQGGLNPISNNNEIYNGDFRIAVQYNTSTKKFPAGWVVQSSNNSGAAALPVDDHTAGGWGYVTDEVTPTDFTARPIRLQTALTPAYDSALYWRLYSRPFTLSSRKYKLRVVWAPSNANVRLLAKLFGSSTTISEEARAIVDAMAGNVQTWPDPTKCVTANGIISKGPAGTGNFLHIDLIGQRSSSMGGTWTVGTDEDTSNAGATPVAKNAGAINVIEYEVSIPDFRDHADTVPIKYASIMIAGQDTSSAGSAAGTVDIHSIELIPIGPPYGSRDSNAFGASMAGTTTYDDEDDPAPDAPREIASDFTDGYMEPLLSSIDIKVTDTTRDSDAKSALLIAAPRKMYTSRSDAEPEVDTSVGSNDDGDNGLAYLYPAPSDLQYLQETTVNNTLGDYSLNFGETRTLKFPTQSQNKVKYMNSISFSKSTTSWGSLGNLQPGFGFLGYGHDAGITGLGVLKFDATFEPTGYAGQDVTGAMLVSLPDTNSLAYYSDAFKAIGPRIQDVKSIYVGEQWNDGGALGVGDGLTGDGTTLSNTYDNAGRTRAQYNMQGGIYIKQPNPFFGVTIISNNGSVSDYEHRWTIGLNTDHDEISFRYAADEDTAVTRYGYIDTDNGSSGYAGDGSGPYAMEVDNGKDLNHFTGQHRSKSTTVNKEDHLGLIVVSTGAYDTRGIPSQFSQININNAHPFVELSSKRNQKSCFGIVSNSEDFDNDGKLHFKFGNWVSVNEPDDEDDKRLIINSLGEGAIWVCNINGNLENGDYITTCEIPGYGMLQDDDLLHNYTVAKITQDCNFELDNPYYDCVEFEFEGNTYRKAFVGCTYHCG